MVKKLHKSSAPPSDPVPTSGSVKDSAQQIWQAGLGAFSKAQAEGTRAFEALVKEGTVLQRKTQAAAEERLADATSRMTHMASDIGSKASGQWGKLESIFEERVAKALNQLGVPSADDIQALTARIDELQQTVRELSEKKSAYLVDMPAKTRNSRASTSPPASTSPAKPAPKRVSSAGRKPESKPAAKAPSKAADKPNRKGAAKATATTKPIKTPLRSASPRKLTLS